MISSTASYVARRTVQWTTRTLLDGHRIRFGNWSSEQLAGVSAALHPWDNPKAIEAVLVKFSEIVVKRIDAF